MVTTTSALGKHTALLCAALLGACQAERGTATFDEFPVPFEVTNNLIAPVTILIDEKPYVAVNGSSGTKLTVSSQAQWLVWRSAKPMDENGVPIPDDIGDIRIPIAGINRELAISNVIQDVTYVTARIFNNTSVPVSIGVFDGTTLSCVSKLPASYVGVRKFTQTGYYRLLPTTELRAYHDPANCTGSYVAWPRSELNAFARGSGLLLLSLDSAP